MDVLVIIPAYNEEGNIKRVVENLTNKYPQYDYVIINDGSKDNTSKICHENHYNILDLPVNLGLAGAFQTGMIYAYQNNYKYAIQFDADGQHRPEYILPMQKKMEEGYDIVIASRFITEKKPHSPRMIGSRMIGAAIRSTTGVRVKDPTSGMRMFRSELIKELALNINFGPEPDTVSFLIRRGAKVAEIQAVMDERTEGESYLNFANSMKYMLRMMISIIVIQNFRESKQLFHVKNKE
ncbi:MAG: glycosyltransferase family 2 protein [Lachnospiraceae bacterium]